MAAKLGQRIKTAGPGASTGWQTREAPQQRAARLKTEATNRRACEFHGQPYDERPRDPDAQPTYGPDGSQAGWIPGSRERARGLAPSADEDVESDVLG